MKICDSFIMLDYKYRKIYVYSECKADSFDSS